MWEEKKKRQRKGTKLSWPMNQPKATSHGTCNGVHQQAGWTNAELVPVRWLDADGLSIFLVLLINII